MQNISTGDAVKNIAYYGGHLLMALNFHSMNLPSHPSSNLLALRTWNHAYVPELAGMGGLSAFTGCRTYGAADADHCLP